MGKRTSARTYRRRPRSPPKSKTTSGSSVSLLSLPTEIRQQIFRYVIPEHAEYSFIKGSPKDHRMRSYMGLLCTCRQVYFEIPTEWYFQMMFHAEIDLSHLYWLAQGTQKLTVTNRLVTIRRLTLSISISEIDLLPSPLYDLEILYRATQAYISFFSELCEMPLEFLHLKLHIGATLMMETAEASQVLVAVINRYLFRRLRSMICLEEVELDLTVSDWPKGDTSDPSFSERTLEIRRTRHELLEDLWERLDIEGW